MSGQISEPVLDVVGELQKMLDADLGLLLEAQLGSGGGGHPLRNDDATAIRRLNHIHRRRPRPVEQRPKSLAIQRVKPVVDRDELVTGILR